MIKPILSYTALCLAITGCAAKQPELRDWAYQYDSQVHSGTVHVKETTNVPNEQCDIHWRNGRTYQPSGVQQTVGFRLELQIHDEDQDSTGELIKVVLPSNQGSDVLVRDLQKTKTLMLSPDANGIMKQGDLFFFPNGYFVRAAQPAFVGNDVTFCLGVDHTYLPDSELSSSNPQINMDRLNIRFAAEPGVEKTYSFGSAKVTVRAVLL